MTRFLLSKWTSHFVSFVKAIEGEVSPFASEFVYTRWSWFTHDPCYCTSSMGCQVEFHHISMSYIACAPTIGHILFQTI